jgi:streptogramin lyase
VYWREACVVIAVLGCSTGGGTAARTPGSGAGGSADGGAESAEDAGNGGASDGGAVSSGANAGGTQSTGTGGTGPASGGSESDAGAGQGGDANGSVQAGQGGTGSECAEYRYVVFDIPTPESYPTDIAVGPDENIWFAGRSSSRIGRVTFDGTIIEFTEIGNEPHVITAGPDGNLWAAINQPPMAIVRFSTTGIVGGTFELSSSLDGIGDITPGPDGNLWFTNGGRAKVGRITTEGTITEFDLPEISGEPTMPKDITSGPDGALWFTMPLADRIGRITTGGDITLFELPPAIAEAGSPASIAVGPDGNFWFPSGALLAWMTPDGAATSVRPSAPNALDEMSVWTPLAGPDGDVWFIWGGGIGRMVLDGSFTYFPPPAGVQLTNLVFGRDGTLWFLELGGNTVGRLEPCAK